MIKIGTPLTLEIEKDHEVERYRCKVVEQQGSFLFVDYPVHLVSGRTNLFERGTIFTASFVGEDHTVYSFETELKDKKKLKIPTLVLNYPGASQLKKVQRREYVRIETAVDVSVHDTEKELRPFTTITQNISGGGLSLVLPPGREIPPGKRLELLIVLPMESTVISYVKVQAEVIRTHDRPEGQRPLLSVKFEEIEEQDRQSIIRYCFEKQLEARRRGLDTRKGIRN
ncbi:flagellar brake protein [Sediminibacillus dalangtanensis]|uniref:Flagellar brake protein n=1 Tax=Sediminibacillus dalangtanensis TaxID=2729421 RepID=A0ABX7VS26_9BACI|nr:PilZ domain-containing protein [Sediminibacillus dalangtanensis]QTM99674.1 flagellar brake protein [Sediminibacillus dalangtanensis]